MRDLLLFVGGSATMFVVLFGLVALWFFRNPPLP